MNAEQPPIVRAIPAVATRDAGSDDEGSPPAWWNAERAAAWIAGVRTMSQTPPGRDANPWQGACDLSVCFE